MDTSDQLYNSENRVCNDQTIWSWICHSVNVTFMFLCSCSLANKCLEATFRGHPAFATSAELVLWSFHWNEERNFNPRQAMILSLNNNCFLLTEIFAIVHLSYNKCTILLDEHFFLYLKIFLSTFSLLLKNLIFCSWSVIPCFIMLFYSCVTLVTKVFLLVLKED